MTKEHLTESMYAAYKNTLENQFDLEDDVVAWILLATHAGDFAGAKEIFFSHTSVEMDRHRFLSILNMLQRLSANPDAAERQRKFVTFNEHVAGYRDAAHTTSRSTHIEQRLDNHPKTPWYLSLALFISGLVYWALDVLTILMPTLGMAGVVDVGASIGVFLTAAVLQIISRRPSHNAHPYRYGLYGLMEYVNDLRSKHAK